MNFYIYDFPPFIYERTMLDYRLRHTYHLQMHSFISLVEQAQQRLNPAQE
jgi:hypothetical protein